MTGQPKAILATAALTSGRCVSTSCVYDAANGGKKDLALSGMLAFSRFRIQHLSRATAQCYQPLRSSSLCGKAPWIVSSRQVDLGTSPLLKGNPLLVHSPVFFSRYQLPVVTIGLVLKPASGRRGGLVVTLECCQR